jgi:hypothetical protein
MLSRSAPPAEAKVDDTRIVGKWHCQEDTDGLGGRYYTFKRDKTWTDGNEVGTYTYDDYTNDLSLSDHAGETVGVLGAPVFGGGISWNN